MTAPPPASACDRSVAACVVARAAAIVGYASSCGSSSSCRRDSAGGAQSVALQQTFNALSIGAIYALIALGYTMVYGIIELINFAHGDIFMIGAFHRSIFLGGDPGSDGRRRRTAVPDRPDPRRARLHDAADRGCSTCAIERLFYRPLRHAPRLAPADHGDRRVVHPPERGARHRGMRRPGSPADLPARPGRSRSGALGRPAVDLHLRPGACPDDRAPDVRRADTPRAGDARDRPGSARPPHSWASTQPDDRPDLPARRRARRGGGRGLGPELRVCPPGPGFNAGLKAFTSAVLGGIGNITGAVLGGFIIGFIENFASSLGYSRWSSSWCSWS